MLGSDPPEYDRGTAISEEAMRKLRIWLARRCIRRAAYHARHLSDGELRRLLEEPLHERAEWVAT